jgi:hypothetical protein
MDKIIAWTVREGVTPLFELRSTAVTVGETRSNDERGSRLVGHHERRVVALDARRHEIDSFPAGRGSFDGPAPNVRAIVAPFVAACYEALLPGEKLPTEERQTLLASGSKTVSGVRGPVTLTVEITRHDGPDGWFIQMSDGKKWGEKRIVRTSLRKNKAGQWTCEGFVLTDEDAASILEEFPPA